MKRPLNVVVVFGAVLLFALGVNLGFALTSIDGAHLHSLRRRVRELDSVNSRLEKRLRHLRGMVNATETQLEHAKKRLEMFRQRSDRSS